ncbi:MULTISPECIES: phytanoyl-CoA dioxygenase family protein [Burkholderia]|uniref:phytanoyl-CoA dioxygenase family protein n=1 Tax=Burkholderia TaxID=32008 RepID=UPI0005317EBC|nr:MULTISPECIES: phytanoyl-CoA dioxygenase family protein [Burkholderia]AOJ67778.1 hypothetical protein WS78_02640 [Burkholderia savannae]KGR94893.1 phytanoyl-CoA dioxygenase family protein [Burkholderia sp. ABCPW 111]KVG43646.1 hypothetical protein WS77_11840 [Burkholderia sp. MSMB0265]KVG88809.1 hypothetical protein WS81_22950 [Burkholderia sp. MSMB2040]KVG92981.1 hypothetical protein WS83_10025 [Burkholderia sp. MSMB2042]
MTTLRDSFHERGYVRLPHRATRIDLSRVEAEYDRLASQAARRLIENPGAPAEAGAVIAVAERADPHTLCRFEYLAGASAYVRQSLVPRLAQLIERVLGEPVSLFKDKCNLKLPGGGAFTAHQDITAYRHFPTRYQVTAALALDPAVAANGGLEMADARGGALAGAPSAHTPRGMLAELPSYDGGARNGDIVDELAARMTWTLVEAQPGDVILFDSYVPHRSDANRSDSMRRMLFFTFNPASEGDLYELYYREKRSSPDNPIFHVATPTQHSAIREAPK